MKAHLFKATCVVLLSLARLPEILLKTQPAVLHLSLLLCDAGGQCRMEIGQLGHAHVQHLPHTGLQVRQTILWHAFKVWWSGAVRRCSLPWSGRRCHAFLCLRRALALWRQTCFSSGRAEARWMWATWTRQRPIINPLRERYHVVNGKQRIICLLVERGHLQCLLKIFLVVFQMTLDPQPPTHSRSSSSSDLVWHHLGHIAPRWLEGQHAHFIDVFPLAGDVFAICLFPFLQFKGQVVNLLVEVSVELLILRWNRATQSKYDLSRCFYVKDSWEKKITVHA